MSRPLVVALFFTLKLVLWNFQQHLLPPQFWIFMDPGFCGLDFGTTNSAIGVQRESAFELVRLEGSNTHMPSAILFDKESGQILMGQSARDMFMQGSDGRLIQSLKTVLGSSTMDYYTHIAGFEYTFMDIIGLMLKYMKNKAEEQVGREIESVVLGRPVFYVDGDPERDKVAQDCMEEIAKNQGFKNVGFQFEPIAAALDYEKTISEEKRVLVVDIGGGTADFSVVNLVPYRGAIAQKSEILANNGIHIGGNIFDTRLSLNKVMPALGMDSIYLNASGRKIGIPSAEFFDLAYWHRIALLKNSELLSDWRGILKRSFSPKILQRFLTVLENEMGYYLYTVVEESKKALTSHDHMTADLGFIEKGFEIEFHPVNLKKAIREEVMRLESMVQDTIKDSGLELDQIDSLYYVGGSTSIPYIRQRIQTLVPDAESVNGDIFGGVAKGLTIDAAKRFG